MQNYVEYIPPKARKIVEFGCGAGEIGRAFKLLQPACHYVGIDEDAALLRQAALQLDQVERRRFGAVALDETGKGKVDCLIYHSSFWQPKYLATVLKAQCETLSAEGQVLVFLDNPGYFHNAMAVLAGKKPLYPADVVLPELEHILQQAGLVAVGVYPQYRQEDTELRKSGAVSHFLEGFAAYCRQYQIPVKTDIWARSFVVRAVRAGTQKPSLLVQTIIGEKNACARVRVEEPNAFCRTIPGVETRESPDGADLNLSRHFPQKVMIRQRLVLRGLTDLQDLETVAGLGYLLMYEIDDNPFLWRKDHGKTNFADFRCCHAIQVSTQPLAELVRQFNPNVVVFPNHLRYLPAKRSYPADSPVTIFFGALNREREWQDIMPVLNDLCRKYGDRLQFKVMFDQRFYQSLQTKHKVMVGTEYFRGFAPYPVYEQALHSADIALLPLMDNEFNRMKSDLKFIESAGHGAVVLASPTVYQDTVRDGETGFIYHDPDEFRQYMELLIGNQERRLTMAESAYRYVQENRLLSQHYEERIDVYRSLIGNLPQLNKELQLQLMKVREELGGMDK